MIILVVMLVSASVVCVLSIFASLIWDKHQTEFDDEE